MSVYKKRDDEMMKDSLLHNVNTAIKQLQAQSCNVEELQDFTGNMWQVQELCRHLDCTLSHGLKSATRGYWTFVRELTHKSTVQLIFSLPRAVSNVTRGWAWLYIALNDRAVESYLKAILEQPKLVRNHYQSHALLGDTQRLQVLIMMSAGLEHLSFTLEPDTANLVDCKSVVTDSGTDDAYQTDSAEEAESASQASYGSNEKGGSDQEDCDDPELGVVSIVTFDPVSGLPQEDIVHSSIRAIRRRRKEKTLNSVKLDTTISSNGNLQTMPPEHDNGPKQQHHQQLNSEEIQIQRESLLNFILKSDVDFTSSTFNMIDRVTETKMPTEAFVVEDKQQRGVYDGCFYRPSNLSDEDASVTLGDTTRADRKSSAKRVSFDPPDASVPVVGEDSNFQVERNPSMAERESPEGQEDPPVMTTSLNATTDDADSKDVFKSSAHALRHSQPWKQLDVAFVESTSKRLQNEIESEVREAKLNANSTTALMEGEVPLENNFHLMLMLEVVQDQEEKVYKVFSVMTGHTEGSPVESFVVVTDKRFYLTHWDQGLQRYVVDAFVLFADIEFLQLSINYQIINLVCTQPRRRYWICTGNEQVTRNIVSILEVSIRRCSQVTCLPCVFTDSTAQSVGLCKWISSETGLNAHSVTIDHYALVTWEDPHAASTHGTDPGGPSMDGHLMYRYSGNSVLGSGHWRAGYFRLKAGVFYLFSEPSDRTFKSYIQLVGGACAGCRRVHSADRPHTFELILCGERSLQLAAPSEVETSEWLQAFLQAVSQGCDDMEATTSPCVSACLIQASQMLFVCHEVLETNSVRCLGKAAVQDVSALHVSDDGPYCIVEFEAVEAIESCGDWVFYFSDTTEMNKFLTCLSSTWQELYQIPLPSSRINDPVLQKHCLEWGKTTATSRLIS